tara:strand:+ start:74 stop:589 length:516 start_codon:yes stop_codon:yes gene_type:complete
MRHVLFSTPVWHIEGTPQQLIDELYKGAYRYKENYKSKPRSSAGGYQTPSFEWDSFHPQGIELINETVDKAIERNFKITEWWYNINGKGHWNHPHTHPNSDFALVMYLTDGDGLLHLMSPFSQRRDDSGDHVSVAAEKGDIIIFPSDITHYVLPNPREEDRISISMNLQLC